MSQDKNKAIIHSIIDNKRISTQDLLQEVYKKIEQGHTEFEVHASGQHNIGGPLWVDGEILKFKVHNPGQRVGSMGMAGTQIIVEGSAPADVGWLNAGAEIIVKGDGGDTTAHCAATGKIFVKGRVGTRSGALMKHDPKFVPPEFWVLKNAGSFSFEFMSGGVAVICGYDCNDLDSVLGARSCVGMVGGTVYVRGSVGNLSKDVWLVDLDSYDKDFLLNGMKEFLSKVDKNEIYKELTNFTQWKKIVAKTLEERKRQSLISVKDFREQKWVKNGIFGDLIEDDLHVSEFVARGNSRLRIPEWKNSAYTAPCEYNCPIGIPTQKRIALLRDEKIEEATKMLLDYSPFPASVCGQVCPNLCLDDCNRQFVDAPVKVAQLSLMSKDVDVNFKVKEKGKKVAVIGSGVAGLGASWQLKKLGYTVDIFEQDKFIGGKLKQVIPANRLDQQILEFELSRFEKIGVGVKTSTKVDKELFEKIEKDYDAVVIAVGAHIPVVIPFKGHEKLVKGLDFLKEINKGNKPEIGEKVVVIGAGNAGMDVVIGAYQTGAKEVTAIDIQKPAAFEKEIDHAKKLGANILWPCFTEEVTNEGVKLKDGTFLEADTVIISVGDRPDVSFVDQAYLDDKGRVKVNEFLQLEGNEKVFIPGDIVKLGLFTNALGDGRKVALNIDKYLSGGKLDNFEKSPMIPRDRVKTEYYPGLTQPKVDAMDALDERDRCLSCGFCRDCEFCLNACPEQAITRIENTDGSFEYVSDPEKCIGCGICAGVCPCGVWTLENNFEKFEES